MPEPTLTRVEYTALTLATEHAIAAGVPEPWNWATEHAAEFLDQAADPAVQERVERDDDAELAEFDAFCFLAPPACLTAPEK